MRSEYDFTKAKLNQYVKKLQKQISIRTDIDTIEYLEKKIDKLPQNEKKLAMKYRQDYFEIK